MLLLLLALAAPVDTCRPLLGEGTPVCAMAHTDRFRLKLTIRERSSGRVVEEVCAPSKYEGATATYVDLPGINRTVVRLSFEGASGTGISQRVLLGVTWDGAASHLRPAFLESASFDVSVMEDERRLTLRHVFERTGTSQPTLRLNYDYAERSATSGTAGGKTAAATPSFRSTWEERFSWNPKTHSFYRDHVEEEHRSRLFSVVRRLAAARANLLRLDLAGTASCAREDASTLLNLGSLGITTVLDLEP